MDLKDKVILITGASMGIGEVTARQLIPYGPKLALAARSIDKLDALASDLQSRRTEALAIPTDLRDPDSIKAMVDATVSKFGRVDVLINNAGQAIAGTIADVNMADLRQIYELNIFAVIEAMQAVIPVMRQQGGGIIANVSSMTSRMNLPGLAGYASTKAALNLLTQTAHTELAPDNIRVLLVLPRLTATDSGKNSLGNRAMRSQQRGNAGERRGDPPELVADKIIQALVEERPEQFMDSE
jgi:short-subunit dehydrogenase